MAVSLFQQERGFSRVADGRWSLGEASIDGATAASASRSRRIDEVPFAVVDLETTGSSLRNGHRVMEFAAVTVKGRAIVEVFETLVNPGRGIPRQISALTHITWEMVRSAPPFRDIATQVASALDGRLFVAHNATFDWRFLAAELMRASRWTGGGRLVGERLCTVRLARALLPHLRRRSLDSLTGYYDIENTARHRAGGDAMATAHVLIRLLREARRRGCETLDDLRALTRPVARRRRRRRRLPYWGDGALPA